MMNVAERKQTNAPADAQQWLASFEAALRANDADAAAKLQKEQAKRDAEKASQDAKAAARQAEIT